MTLTEINNKIQVAKRKLARAVSGLTVAKRRIRHFKKRERIFAGRGDTKSAARANRYLRRWQKRQTKIHARRLYIQLVLDKRLKAKHEWLKKHPQHQFPDHGLVTLDGHQVASWIAEICVEAREAGYWNGYIISGWRSKQYSRELCENMCGAASCPGRCAGESTNHTGIDYPAGAVDVTDSAGLIRFARAKGKPLHGAGEVLPYDTPHCSYAGN